MYTKRNNKGNIAKQAQHRETTERDTTRDTEQLNGTQTLGYNRRDTTKEPKEQEFFTIFPEKSEQDSCAIPAMFFPLGFVGNGIKRCSASETEENMLMSQHQHTRGCCFSFICRYKKAYLYLSDVFVSIGICQMYLYLSDVFVLVIVKGPPAVSVADASVFGLWPQQRVFRVYQEAVRILCSKFYDKKGNRREICIQQGLTPKVKASPFTM